ncbi:MAG: hypothetical protein CW338_05580, partial [Clostridiales bacterium]|nr:hypothetical protein [Clostridiales bacterium]
MSKPKIPKAALIRRIIVWSLIAILLIALVTVLIIIYTQEEKPQLHEPSEYDRSNSEKTLTLENERLKLEVSGETTWITVTDKKTGKKWTSNAVKADDASVPGIMKSTLVVTYTPAGNTDLYLYNYDGSIRDEYFNAYKSEDGEKIIVDYYITTVRRPYTIPQVIEYNAFKAYTSQMSKKDAKKVEGMYSVIKWGDLDEHDHEVLAEQYPEYYGEGKTVKPDTKVLYIIKEVKNDVKLASEVAFLDVGYTQEQCDADMEFSNSLDAGVKKVVKAAFNVTVEYSLDGDDLHVEIPYEKIGYMNEFPISYISVLPMFGSVDDKATNGFILLPEGGGAIIDVNNGKLKQTSYYSDMYGWDYCSQIKTEWVNETRSTFPVFGISDGTGSSFICIAEDGSSFAGLYADIAGRNSISANYAYYRMAVLHYTQYKVSARTARMLYMYEKDLPHETVSIRYRFIDSPDYADMALTYGDYLRNSTAVADAKASEDMPVTVELIGAIDKVVVKAGLPVDSVVTTTSYDQAKDIISSLLDSDVRNLYVRMAGWCNDGITQTVLTSVSPVSGMGGKKGMKTLIAYAKEKGVPVFFDGITCFAYDSGLFDGFLPFSHAARMTTRDEVKVPKYSNITFKSYKNYGSYYLVKPSYAQKCVNNLIEYLSDVEAAGVSFRDIGKFLSGDYNNKDTVTREEVKRMNISAMVSAAEQGMAVMIREGNDYAVPYADVITDMNFVGSGYSILDRNVPFYQIALHGMKDYTGQPINLAPDYWNEFLRCAEYGAGLNFTFMAESAQIVQESDHSCYYGANFDDWEATAVALINEYQTSMAGLNQARITGHSYLSVNVTVTEYENGMKVYVNYGS